jgi:hypothetical protein
MKLPLLSNSSSDPGIPFEDEVLVPEAANPKTANDHLFSTRTNIPLEILSEVEEFQRNLDPTEGKRDDLQMLSKLTITNKMPPFCPRIASASIREPSLT